ncbi:MAG: hypothetical protein LC792_18765, partial [Actinobacteria bacterium]|nr:hypothetical protein [Actinomycetota bacterium]
MAGGHPAEALSVVEPLVAANPFRERLRGQQMLSLYQLGRQADALVAAQDLRRTLADELGLIPNPAIQTLENQILRQSPELSPPPAERLVAPANGLAGPNVGLSGGTLAFVFTDIEASTRRWEGDRAAMAADLARHDAVLREAFSAHSGQLFTHTGDGLGAAFPTVPDALSAAVAGQRGLADVTWSGSAPLRVRMAVHAGTAEARAGTFLGPTLNRTARLLDEAAGGQILCSQAAADLARDELPPDMTVTEVGERILKGLSRPERIWQVIHPDLPPAAAPPPAAELRMPAALTPFVGREAELAELAALLPETRLLTITGFGGAGKTRLALELAARMGRHRADGYRVVEFATIQDDRPLAAATLVALGVDGGASSGLAPEEQLCRVLARQDVLLVLDNCEHVLTHAAALADLILRRCPAVSLVATSREVLAVGGEHVWAAPPLSLPPADASTPGDLTGSDAAALFILRARTAQPGFGPGPANANAIARICRQLDGMPLALELAAARVRVLSAGQIADRLDDRLRLLTAGTRSAPARHQTLRATMDWSFELLSEPEQRLLRRLSVLPQDFDLEAATAVADDDADALDVLDLLARLVDKSLLVAEGAADGARYRLLETVRQYGAEKLAEFGEQKETERRHRDHFAERVRSARRRGVNEIGLEWAREVDRESEHYNAALASALAAGDHERATVLIAGLGYPWQWGTPVPPVMDSVDPDMLTCSEASLLMYAFLGLAVAGRLTGRWNAETAVTLYERALAVADQAGTAEDQGLPRYFLGQLAQSRGDAIAARRWMEEALERFSAGGSMVEIYARFELGWFDLLEGHTAEARSQFQPMLARAEALPGGEVETVHLRAALALVEAVEGETTAAIADSDRAVRKSASLGLPRVTVMALVRAAEVAAVAGVPTGPKLPQALRLLRAQGALRWVASALTLAAVEHEARGRPDLAAQLLGGAAAVAATMGEEPVTLPRLRSLVSEMRRELDKTLGADSRIAIEETGG